MLTALSLLLLLAPSAEPALTHAMQLTYGGEIVADKGDPAETRKKFKLKMVVDRAKSGTVVYWSLEETGRGGWAWPMQAGSFPVDERWQPQPVADSLMPSLLYSRDTGAVAIPLLAPAYFTTNPMKQGEQWQKGRTTFTVGRQQTVAGAGVWPVEVTTPFGRRRTMYVARNSELLAAVDEVVFMGQGEQHQLTYQLTDHRELSEAALTKLKTSISQFEDLRATLLQASRPKEITWSKDQLTTATARIEQMRSSSPFIATALDAARADLQQQSNRSGALTTLVKNVTGKPAPAFELKKLSGGTVSSDGLKDHVTVLHFWPYRDTPLKQPYGQTGFLDYLYRQHKADKVQVFGVVTDKRLKQEETASAAVRSARKFQQFMNLSYPLLLDSGELISKLGDPRPAGAELPLFVVIDRSGVVRHYHAGLYEVQRNRGLSGLDEEIKNALNRE